MVLLVLCNASFFFSSRRRHTRFDCDWSSDVCSSDLHISIYKMILKACLFIFYLYVFFYFLLRHAFKMEVGRGKLEELPTDTFLCYYFEIGRASCRERV